MCTHNSLSFPARFLHAIHVHSAIKLSNATNVIINDISLEMWTFNIPGIVVEQSKSIHLQLDILCGVVVNEPVTYMEYQLAVLELE